MWANKKTISSEKNNRRGFTIVELLIVIVVIGILAAITIVAYNGIQQRARDSTRISDLSQLRKALMSYSIDNGSYISTGSGCGISGNGEGWTSYKDGAGYPNTMNSCLITGKYLQREIVDPSGCTNDTIMAQCNAPRSTAYLKVNCTDGSGMKFAYLFARLEGTGAVAAPSEVNSYCPNASWYATFGMNYALRVG